MVNVKDTSEQEKLRAAIDAWIAEEGLELAEPRGGGVRIRLPISEERTIAVSMLPLKGGIIYMLFTDIQASEETLADTALLLCFLNSEMPYAVFEMNPRDGIISCRDYIYTANGEVSSEVLRFTLGSILYCFDTYCPIIQAVAEGLIDYKAAIDKVVEREQRDLADEGE